MPLASNIPTTQPSLLGWNRAKRTISTPESATVLRKLGYWNPYEAVIDAPPGLVVEFVGGILRVMGRPSWEHGRFCFNFAKRIAPPYEDDLCSWKFMIEPLLLLSEDAFIPDLVGWRLPLRLENQNASIFAVVPDWVCEVLSSATRRYDLGVKRDNYAKHGVAFLWTVDPIAETVEAFALKDGEWQEVGTASGEGALSLPPFEVNSFPLSVFWE